MNFTVARLYVYITLLSIATLNCYDSHDQPIQHAPAETTFAKKRCTILVYATSRNSLSSFLDRNLKQLMQVGTNDDITIVVHLDLYGSWFCKLTQRFILYKDHMVQIGPDMELDSGDPKTFHDACRWAFTNFPADMNILVLWNHGSGDLEPNFSRAVDPSVFYVCNPKTNLLELDRSLHFLEYLEAAAKKDTFAHKERGICFDECTNHYLTNHQVGAVLRDIQHTCLGGKPLDILYCDACLMMGIGFAYSLKPYKTQSPVRYLVASQEVTLAYGFDYAKMFVKIAEQPMTAQDFVTHAIQVFAEYYKDIAYDYTQSALCMEKLDTLYEHVDTLGAVLIEGLTKQQNRSVKKCILQCSASNQCMSFEEPSYKDLSHFCSNILNSLDMITLHTPAETVSYQQRLRTALQNCCTALEYVVCAHSSSESLKNAHGLSIYIAYDKIYSTFPIIDFALHTSWLKMLALLVNS